MGLFHAHRTPGVEKRSGPSEVIAAAIGRPPTLFRPPYGSFSGATAMIATSMRYPIMLWDIEFNQHHGDTGAANVERLSKLTGPGSVARQTFLPYPPAGFLLENVKGLSGDASPTSQT